jgi:translation initiation factor IF-3
MNIAEQNNLDLVEVSPTAKPPVCKVMDFGKYKYELSKKEKETKKKQHVIVTKEVRLRPKIEEHDYMFKMRNARKFIEQGNRVKVSLFFRGREMVHKELGFEIMNRFLEDMSDIAKPDKPPKMEGNQIIMFLAKK